MPDDRDLPGIPRRHVPARDRLDTRPDPPGRGERKPTVKVAVPPPGAGNRTPPGLDDTQESPGGAGSNERNHPPRPTFRRPSPPPVEEGPPTSAEYGAKVAELGDRIESLQERAERAEAALAREKRKSSPRVESEAPPATSRPPSRADWSKLLFQLLTLVSLGGAGYAAAKPPPPAPPTKEVEVYAALRDEVIRLNEAQRTQAADLAELRAWLKGYFDATGVKVVDPPGAPPPKPVELAPAPLPRPHRLGRAPDVQVRTPLPAPRPVPEPVKLPASIEALPKAP